MLLLECCLRSGLLLPLQGVVEGTVRLPRALWSWLAGAGAGCCCRVLLQGAAWGAAEWRVRFGSRLLVPLQCYSGVCAFELAAGTAGGCRCFRVVLLKWCVRFMLVQGRCRVRVQGTAGKGLSAS